MILQLFESGNNNLLPILAKADYRPYGCNFSGAVTGRFTNGRTVPDVLTCLDLLAELLVLPNPPPYLSFRTSGVITGVNFASGGCGILPDTGNFVCFYRANVQVRLFESAALNDLQRLFKSSDEFSSYLAKSILAFSIGNNDNILNILNPTFYNTSKTYKTQPLAKFLVAVLSRHLESLYNRGARKFIAFEIRPMGCIPAISRKSKHDGVCDEGSNFLVSYSSQMLQPMLENMTSSLAGSMFIIGRANSLGYDAIINPSRYGLTNSRNPCCTTCVNGTLPCVPLLTPCPNADKHFFWDGYHPTDVVSSIRASRCFNDTKVCSPVSIQDLIQI
ncbi:GDSL esterase/lipase 7 [Eucalyptus grandis]|uniref:GDSL esterase/lipase 7 n=1 Tax=Eucalyptus grandis TaxID=71139 RepID=UPI00192ECB33|nr:GDSL esterase/lipase 7 [Eucalyptus grandis]